MKKAFFIALAIGGTYTVQAQRSAVQSAINYLNDKDYDHAKEYIEKATNDASTANEPKTWYTKGNIYYAMQQDTKYKDSKPYQTAAAAYMKVEALKQGYNKDIPSLLFQCAIYYFNDGIHEYNERKFDDSYTDMKSVVDIHNTNSGKLFAGNKYFDTIATKAKLMMANDLYYANKLDEALVLFTELKDNPITKAPNIYMLIADIDKKQNKNDQWLAIIQEGRKAYPEDENLRADELNYYIKTGKQDELAKKLEDAVAKDPGNGELQYTLGTTYEQMAFPEGAAPANYADLVAKAEKAFLNALKVSPDNTSYNYNMGALYIDECTPINNAINNITGTSAADQKKYNELKAQVDALQAKAQPYLEKVYTTMDAHAATLKGEDRSTYLSTIRTLRQLYAKQNKLDKSAEMKKKEDAFK